MGINTAFDFYYDDDHNRVLTLTSEGQWADFRRDGDGVYFAESWGPTVNMQGSGTAFMRGLWTILDTVKTQWPGVDVDDDEHTLTFDEGSKALIKLKHGFTIL